mmetsp:Transcript_29638/g.40728  ORF Transcript_29638/g.40728 Transcript_29638/m.40728 type:complete len:141 (-) Transcript_29638:793-1215(-)
MMEDIYHNYCISSDKLPAVARFLTIYIEEAHASDEWWLPDSPEAQVGGKAYIRKHRSLEERLVAAKSFVNDFKFPIEVVCDSFENEVWSYFECWPERLYIIQYGHIVYQGGKGPFNYKLAEVKDWLSDKFGPRGDPIARR